MFSCSAHESFCFGICRTQLHDIKQRNLLADAEACSFEARADRVANEVLVRSHEEKNLQKEVVGLKRELHITQMEVAELRTELEFELTAKEHTTDLIARAQMELQAQIVSPLVLQRLTRTPEELSKGL